MALKTYSKQEEFLLPPHERDPRGWLVCDPSGQSLGKVTDLVFESDTGLVDAFVIDTGAYVSVNTLLLDTKGPGEACLRIRDALPLSKKIPGEDLSHQDPASEKQAPEQSDTAGGLSLRLQSRHELMSVQPETRAEHDLKTDSLTNSLTNSQRSLQSSYRTGLQNPEQKLMPREQSQDDIDGAEAEEAASPEAAMTREPVSPVSGKAEKAPDEIASGLNNSSAPPRLEPANALAAFESGSFEVMGLVEELLLQKRQRVVEELVVNTRFSERTQTIHATLIETFVDVETFGAAPGVRTERVIRVKGDSV